MIELILENYSSIVDRGLITEKTTEKDFQIKLIEEVVEVCNSQTTKELAEELADVILTSLNYAYHYDIDIELELKSKIETNKNRAK